MAVADDVKVAAVHPAGEQLPMEVAVEGPVTAETFAGRVHLEWEPAASVTTMGQLAFFIEYLKQAGLFDGFVAGCPLHLTSPNAPSKRDVLGTVLLSVLAGHRRYAHVTALRGDGVNAPLLGMRKVVSEDAVLLSLSKGGAGQDRGGCRCGLAARAARVLHAAAAGRALDARPLADDIPP